MFAQARAVDENKNAIQMACDATDISIFHFATYQITNRLGSMYSALSSWSAQKKRRHWPIEQKNPQNRYIHLFIELGGRSMYIYVEGKVKN